MESGTLCDPHLLQGDVAHVPPGSKLFPCKRRRRYVRVFECQRHSDLKTISSLRCASHWFFRCLRSPACTDRLWFDGWKGRGPPPGRFADADRPPEVAAPRTWLLSKGWRRIGLVDPAEVPGG